MHINLESNWVPSNVLIYYTGSGWQFKCEPLFNEKFDIIEPKLWILMGSIDCKVRTKKIFEMMNPRRKKRQR